MLKSDLVWRIGKNIHPFHSPADFLVGGTPAKVRLEPFLHYILLGHFGMLGYKYILEMNASIGVHGKYAEQLNRCHLIS